MMMIQGARLHILVPSIFFFSASFLSLQHLCQDVVFSRRVKKKKKKKRKTLILCVCVCVCVINVSHTKRERHEKSFFFLFVFFFQQCVSFSPFF